MRTCLWVGSEVGLRGNPWMVWVYPLSGMSSMTGDWLRLTDGCPAGGVGHQGVGEGGPGRMQTLEGWTSSGDGTLTFWQL